MKKHFIFFLSFVLSLFSLISCISNNTTESKLILKVPVHSNTNSTDSVIFTGKDINWFNADTQELSFVNPPSLNALQKFIQIKFFLGIDSLFTARIALDIMSASISNLVLHLNNRDGKFYLEDGYPNGNNVLSIQNKEKRAAAWAKFIAQLKLEGRYKE